MEIGEPAQVVPRAQQNVSVSVSFLRDRSELQELWDVLLEGRPAACVARFEATVQPDGPFERIAEVVGPKGVVRRGLPCTGGGLDPIAAKWDGRAGDGSAVPAGEYRIRLRVDCRGVSGSAESDAIKVVRVGVVAAAFSGRTVYPLKFAFRDFPRKYDSDDFDVPAWQWKLASLHDRGRPRRPPGSAPGRSADASTYCYPIAAKRSSKLKPLLRTAGAGYTSSDGISLKVLRADGSPWSDETARSIQIGKTYGLEANEANELPASVGKVTDLELAFAFEYTSSKGQAIRLGLQRCSRMTVYVLVSEPQNPWGRGSGANRQRPWVELLEKACTSWARGARTVHEAASLVTESVNSKPKMNLTYDVDSGDDVNRLTEKSGTRPNKIRMRKVLRWLAGDVTRPDNWNVVNCTVCGALVSTISNALGCSIHSSWMGMGFGCHKIIAIGDLAWHHPFHGPGDTYGGFNYHEVGWTGAAGAGDAIYDACLQVASDPVATPARNPLLAKGMTYATSSLAIDDYVRRLVVPADVAMTKPLQAYAGRYKPE